MPQRCFISCFRILSLISSEPMAIVAAGHAAGYALQLAQQSRKPAPELCWLHLRGEVHRQWARVSSAVAVRQLVRSPLIELSTNLILPSFLSWMYRRHVYTDATKLTPRIYQTQAPTYSATRSQICPAAFVTGALDRHKPRRFSCPVPGLSIPVMVVIGEQAPPKSKAEMEALAEPGSAGSFPLLWG